MSGRTINCTDAVLKRRQSIGHMRRLQIKSGRTINCIVASDEVHETKNMSQWYTNGTSVTTDNWQLTSNDQYYQTKKPQFEVQSRRIRCRASIETMPRSVDYANNAIPPINRRLIEFNSSYESRAIFLLAITCALLRCQNFWV